MNSSEIPRCAECSGELPPGLPRGLCPRCALQAAAGLSDGQAQTAPVNLALPTAQPGDHIGRYKLLQQIGEGGCGVVFMAEQEEPIRRKVALKVIKLGMDTRIVIARFEAERQALALMEHANIAKVLDAGATETGRPYFVMELVKGVRITEYCDQHNLTTTARLDLFTQVCHAIQHAHQKGIIHRDIKPSNILVTLHDGVPVPKVIDFGIAKATSDQRLTDKTLFTAFEQFMGTPAYMSPEQAEMSGLNIDTRSDIYSLGVLLYELLTGRTPFDAKELMASGLDEMRRTIREVEPQRPSTRLSTMLATDLTSIAHHRQTEASKLTSSIDGDLDWIVMKALEKDRVRRYDTANGLALDIARYRNNEPVVARPPSHPYRFRKLVRRNKLAFSAAGAVAIALMLGLIVSTRLYFQQREARQRAETETKKSQQVAGFLKDMLGSVGPSVAVGRDTAMLREILDHAAVRVGQGLGGQPEAEAELRNTIGSTYDDLGDHAKAEAMHRVALRLRQSLFGPESLAVAESLDGLGRVLLRREKFTEAEPLFREALAIRTNLLGNFDPLVAMSLDSLGSTLLLQERAVEAELLLRKAMVMKRQLAGTTSPEFAHTLLNLGRTLWKQGKVAEAEPMIREALAVQRKLLSDSHPDLIRSVFSTALLLIENGRQAEAEPLLHEAFAMGRKSLGEGHPDLTWALGKLGLTLVKGSKAAEAEPWLREILAKQKVILGDAHPDVGISLANLGLVLTDQGKFDEAEPFLLQGLANLQQSEKAEAKDQRAALTRLIHLYEVWGKPRPAAEWRQKLAAYDKK